MAEWKLADAKNRFSELVNLALMEGPQTVYRRKDAVVVLSAREYERLKRSPRSFKDYLLKGVSFEEIDLERDASTARDVSL